MIFDSNDQKEFIFKVLRSYICPYGESLAINQMYAPAIQSGVVVDRAKQQEFLGSLENPPKAVFPIESAKKASYIDGNGHAPEEEPLPEVLEGLDIGDKLNG